MQEHLAIKINNLTKIYNKVNKINKKKTFKDLFLFLFHNKNYEEFYALNDLSLEVNKGDVVGIIGSNGAGKSTLLKVLSNVIIPTKGKIEIRGNVATVLEIGLGFHPELTGRDNIQLSSALIGMNKGVLKDKTNQIIEFAGIKNFIDTPVKHYSSGMFVRLAFSIAIHTEADIFLFDEVLSMGDLKFQIKIKNKIEELKKQNKTILMISHNLFEITKYCSKTLLLKDGKIKAYGDTPNIIEKYFELIVNNNFEDSVCKNIKHELITSELKYINENNDYFEILNARIYTHEEENQEYFLHEDKIFIELEILKKDDDKFLDIAYTINKLDTQFLASSANLSEKDMCNQIHKKGKYKICSQIDSNLFNKGNYRIDVSSIVYEKNKFGNNTILFFRTIPNGLIFNIKFEQENQLYNFKFNGPIRITNNWKITKYIQ